jgi:hypothetical protein
LAGSTARSDVAKPAPFDPANPPTTMHLNWSRPVDGMRVRLTCDHPVVRVGQSVNLTFKLENAGNQMRSVQLPMVRPLIVGAEDAVQQNAKTGTTGDLVIIAEPLDGDGKPSARQNALNRNGEIGPFPILPGQQVWITVAAGGSPRLAPVKFLGGAGGGRGPMLHMQESALFPGLNRPGRYRVTAFLSATGVVADPFQQQVQVNGNQMNVWSGRLDTPPIDIEVVEDAAEKQ